MYHKEIVLHMKAIIPINCRYMLKTKIDQVLSPMGAPDLTTEQSQTFPVNKTPCSLFLKNYHERFVKLTNIPFCFNLKMGPSPNFVKCIRYI